MRPRPIELLAPAKNLECGLAAVEHGADAVYIGAPRFGARAAAGNSLEDIARLVEYAHVYGVRVYVTVNTILKDEELSETERLIHDLYRIGVDALIVQDMGITRLSLPPIPLHASTQMDNRTPEKVRFLAEAGFRQVVLERRLRSSCTGRSASVIAGNAMPARLASGAAPIGASVPSSAACLSRWWMATGKR